MDTEFKSLPFDEAIDFFRQKVSLPTAKWTDLWEGMHSRAFVVAGAMKSELLSDLYGSIDKALKEGTTIEDFRKDFDKTVAKHGWSYKGNRGWRTGVIFNTNMLTAYSTGRYKQMTDPDVVKARPFWRYMGGLSANPRPDHLTWSGIILPQDDPWWKTHYPPNGWGCKCQVVSVSNTEMQRDKLKVSKAPIDKEAIDTRTGEVTIKGIDPGWAYNPGEAAWGRNEALRLMEDKGPWVDLEPRGPSAYGRPEKITVDKPHASLGTKARTEDELRNALKKAIGGDEVGIIDPTGETTMVTQAIVDHMLENPKRLDGREIYFPFIRELIENPFEIWIGFAKSEVSGRVGIRKRYVKSIQMDKKRVIGMYAESWNGQWVSGDLFRGGLTGAGNLRKGRLLYGRE